MDRCGEDPAASPLVSIIVASISSSDGLQRTLNSLRRQTLRDIEVVLVGPHVPGAQSVQNAMTDIPLRFVHASGNLAVMWNSGLAPSSGKYVCHMTAGDEIEPTYLEKCVFVLAAFGLDLCAAQQRRGDTEATGGPFSLEVLLMADVSSTAAVLLREAVCNLGGFDPSVADGQVIRDFWVRLARIGGRGQVFEEALVIAKAEAAEIGLEPEFSPAKDSDVLLKQVRPGGGERCDVPKGAAPLVETELQSVRAGASKGVLVVLPFLVVGGAERSVSGLCHGLKELGFRIFVVTTDLAEAGSGDSTNWFADSAAGIYHLPRFLGPSRWPEFISSLIRQHSLEILWQVGSTFVYEFLPRLKSWFPSLAVVDLLFNRVHHPEYKTVERLVDRVIVEHRQMREWLIRNGTPPGVIAVIPNGIDLTRYTVRPKRDWQTGEPRSGVSRFVVGFIGRLSEEKGPDIFLQIVVQLRQRVDLEFLICGIGPMDENLRRQCHADGLDGRVHFLGLLPATKCIPYFDVTVVCSRDDGRPNVIMESLAMGVPVIASRTGGIAEMLPEGSFGRLCEQQDVEGFARAIKQLVNDSGRDVSLAQAARRWAEESFSIAHSVDRYAELFQGLSCFAGPTLAADSAEIRDSNGFFGRSVDLVRFICDVLSPSNIMGTVRTIWLYVRLKHSDKGPEELRYGFDPGFYCTHHRGVARSSISPLWYYLLRGFREGHDPSRFFDTGQYLAVHPDVFRAGVNPLLHHLSRTISVK